MCLGVRDLAVRYWKTKSVQSRWAGLLKIHSYRHRSYAAASMQELKLLKGTGLSNSLQRLIYRFCSLRMVENYQRILSLLPMGQNPLYGATWELRCSVVRQHNSP